MRTKSKQLVINFCFLLLSFAVVSVSFSASSVSPLTPEMVKGKPGKIRSNETPQLSRLMELLVLGKAPANVPLWNLLEDGHNSQGNESQLLCLLAARHLDNQARQTVLEKVTNGHCNTGRQGYRWVGTNRLAQEDSMALFKKKYLPQIREAAGRVAAFKGFQEIIFVNWIRVTERNYSSEKGGFVIGCCNTSIPMLHLMDYKNPAIWKVSRDRAKQIMDGPLRSGGGLMLEMVIQLGDLTKMYGKYGIEGHIKSMALYDFNDKSLSRPLHQFARSDYIDMDKIAGREAQAREQARLGSLQKLELADAAYFAAAYADLSGKGMKLVDDMLARRRYSSDPWQAKQQKEKDRMQFTNILKQGLANFDRNKAVWISGVITLNNYNVNKSYFPLKSIKVHIGEYNKDEKNQWVRVQLVRPQIAELPVPPELARKISARFRGAYAGGYRALVKPVNANESGYVLELAVERLELLADNKNVALMDEKNIVWRYTPTSYGALHAEASRKQAEQQKSIDQQRQACIDSKSYICYSKVCAQLRDMGKTKEWKSCMDESRRLARAWEREKSLARRETLKSEQKQQYQQATIVASCNRKYTGYGIQPWMPAKGTPEYEAAMKQCQKLPVQEVHGPDILGLRLGMPMNDANNLIRRQSLTKNTISKETRPFEKAALYWSDDANHGIAVFSLMNGGFERVAGVSRRLYAGNKKTTASQVISGLRNKYGKEQWSSGNKKLLWTFPDGSQKPSAKLCSGLTKLIEPRAGWMREWSAGDSRRQEREQRQSRSMERVGRQQECMAKHGMPTNPAAMQEFARCMQNLPAAPAASGVSTGGNGARLPMMIRPNGSPGLYANYKACGPVVVAELNSDGTGMLTDMSLVLINPDWVARQPAFAFKSGKGGGQIDF